MKKILLLLTFLTGVYSIGYAQCTNPITGGIIGADQTICYGSFPAAIVQMAPPTNIVGTPTYVWQASTTSTGLFTTIPSATNANYAPPMPLTQDIYIRRIITDPETAAPCNVATSNVVHITVRPELTAGTIGYDETICLTTYVTSTMEETSAPTGGTGTYTYQWQASTSGIAGTFFSFSQTNSSSYNAGGLSSTMYYQRITTSGTCGSVTSNIITKTVSIPEIVSVSINDPGQICASLTPIIFTANVSPTGTGILNYQWFLGSIAVGTNNSNYSYVPVVTDFGKTVKVVITSSNGCNYELATSNSVNLFIINAAPATVSITTNSTVNCAGLYNSFYAGGAGNGSAPKFQWYVIPAGSSSMPGNPVGTDNRTFNSYSLQNGDKVYVELTPFSGCILNSDHVISNILTMDIRPIPNSMINEGDQTICTGESFIFTSTSTSIIPQTILQWRLNNIPIAGATNETYTATEAGNYTLLEDNGICNSVSPTVQLTVDPCGAFSTNITGPNPISPGQQNAVYSVTNQTGFTYTWSITGGTIVSGQNTNAVTVDWDALAANAFARTTSASYSISVTETDQLNQSKTTTLDVNTITTGTTLSQAQSGINVFPNPTTGSFNIEMPESGVAVSYEILDLTGRSVDSGTFTSSGGDQKIDANLDAGMYQIVLKYNNVVTCVRLSKVQ